MFTNEARARINTRRAEISACFGVTILYTLMCCARACDSFVDGRDLLI